MADLDAIRAPIPGDVPGGIYLKGDRSAYRALRNAFNAAQSAYRAFSETAESLSDQELQEANADAWSALSEAAETVLTETSKDLEILCWWVASQVHGKAPLSRTAEALAVLADMIEADMDALQPIPPEEKLKGDTDEARAAEIAELKLRPFVQLFGEVDGSGLLFVPLTNVDLGQEITYGSFILTERDGELDTLRSEFVTIFPSGEEALTAKAEALDAMAKDIDRINTVLRTFASTHKQDPVATGYLGRHVKEILRAIGALTEGTGFRLPGAEEEEAEAEGGDASAEGGEEASQGSGGTGGKGGVSLSANIAGRDAALSQIAELARYFRKSEPHSPISTLLDRAVRWGQMPAEELFQEILRDGSDAFNQLALVTGLESAGFADRFGKRSGSARAPVEMPQLDNYSAPVVQTPAASTASSNDGADSDGPGDPPGDSDDEAPKIAKFEL